MIGQGSLLRTRLGSVVRLERLIGEGGQGAVWLATTDTGHEVAAKWYFPMMATAAQRAVIADLVERGAPNDRFLWPYELLDCPGEAGFGYLMPLRPSSYAGLAELLTGKVDVGFGLLCRLCMELADSILGLHSVGLCYRDVSFGNVFFAPSTGQPLICDNDNVGIDGVSESAVLGTRRFMAPEIVRRDAAPSSATDLYSLSVLLFYVLMMGHPLVGRRENDFACWDDAAETVLFGREPLFVFDPADERNAPDPEVHASVLRYWGLYPAFVRDLFVQAFTVGLQQPDRRVRGGVWRTAMARLRDRVVRCTVCGKENFVEETGAPPSGLCWDCGADVQTELWLELPAGTVAVALGSTVVGHHLTHDYDFTTRVAEVVGHPQREDVLGLQNATESTWSVTLPGGEERTVEPGRSVKLSAGTVVELGHGATCRVRAS